jgi:hypothetical protein
MATIDECIEFALKNIGLWWRYGISRHCDEWTYIIVGRIFESEIILIPPSLKISESSSNESYRNTGEVWWRYGISQSCDEWCIYLINKCRQLFNNFQQELSFFDCHLLVFRNMYLPNKQVQTTLHKLSTIVVFLWLSSASLS